MPASITPTRWPGGGRAAARLAETVDFPTPPLPEDTASTRPRCGIASGVGGGGTAPAPAAPAPLTPPAEGGACFAAGSTTLIFTADTPTTACTALRAARARVAGAPRVRGEVKDTAPAAATTGAGAMPAG